MQMCPQFVERTLSSEKSRQLLITRTLLIPLNGIYGPQVERGLLRRALLSQSEVMLMQELREICKEVTRSTSADRVDD